MTEISQLILANWEHEKQAFFVNNVTVNYPDAIDIKDLACIQDCFYILK